MKHEQDTPRFIMSIGSGRSSPRAIEKKDETLLAASGLPAVRKKTGGNAFQRFLNECSAQEPTLTEAEHPARFACLKVNLCVK